MFYCLRTETPQPGRPSPIFISPRNKVGKLYPQALSSPFVMSSDSQGCDRGIQTCLYVLLTDPAYNTSPQTAYKTSLPLLVCFLTAMETCLFAMPFLSSGCCIFACFAVLA
jgi:hypothetical protein